MSDCPCGTILFPKGSKYDPEGLSIEIIHANGSELFSLVHNEEALLSNGNTFITSTAKIPLNASLNIKQFIIKCGSKYNLIASNIISVIIRTLDSNFPICYESFGSLSQTFNFRNREGRNEIILNVEEQFSANLFNNKLVVEVYSLCENLSDNCCDKLPSTIDIVPSSITYAPCYTTTTTTTTTVPPTTTTLSPPCQSFDLPERFNFIAVGYGVLDGQEIETEAVKNGNTWYASGTFPCGASFSLQMTCDPATGKFVYDGEVGCCDPATKYVTDPSNTPYIAPNTRIPLIVGYTECSCNPACSSTTTTTTPPPVPCTQNTQLTINGYAFYSSSNIPKNIPGIGLLTPRCFGGHQCNNTNFIPELITSTVTVQGSQISLNNLNDGGDRVASFSFNIPDASILKGGASVSLKCVDQLCHNNVTWIVLTTVVDGQTKILFNGCVLPNSLDSLSYECKTCCDWDGRGFIEFGETCNPNNKRVELHFLKIGDNLWESKGFNVCGDFCHFIVSCDPNINPPYDSASCSNKWKVLHFDVSCAVNPRITNQILELCTCDSPPVWVWLADDISACKCCNCANAVVIVDGTKSTRTSSGLMVSIGDFISTSSTGRIIYDTVTNRFLDAPNNLAIFIGNTSISLGQDLNNYQANVAGELQFLYPDNPYFDNNGFYTVNASVCGSDAPLPPQPTLPPPITTTSPPGVSTTTTTTAPPQQITSLEITSQPKNYRCPYGFIYGCVGSVGVTIRLKDGNRTITNNTSPITYSWDIYDSSMVFVRTLIYTSTSTSNTISVDSRNIRIGTRGGLIWLRCTITVGSLSITSNSASIVPGAIA